MASPNAPLQTPPPPPSSSSQQQQSPSPANANAGNAIVHNVALCVTPIALLALFLPPRRLDIRALILGGVAVWGTSRLVYDYSGNSSLQSLQRRLRSLAGPDLPEKARQTQIRLRAERAERTRLQQLQEAQADLPEEQRKMLEEQRQQRKQQQQGPLAGQDSEERKGAEAKGAAKERSLFQRIWMGNEGDDWKEERARREREAFSEGGGGYWGLITDQIAEAWNESRKKEGEKNDQNTESEGSRPKGA
ncbi:hypothetical protein GGS23DRAFT_431354 [Durotheca rogersii]|uniref:uncharacterized protein n=1 Tax=Durotheca rogersii TaxID=419775 RepID=UPI0022202D5A|nr:uncharacterized protein GGS23DRAFT_431354 [Durotheca rogersii]KAI5865523.1 hypothetical protein GGS23DRAFT_431354 [Durotheca rogersii]